MTERGVILFSHGSRREASNRAFKKLVDRIDDEEHPMIRPAFLEFAEPDLKDAVKALKSHDVSKIVIVPVFLFPGNHVEKDLPNLVEELRKEHEKIDFTITDVLASHPKFRELIEERIKEGLDQTD